MKIDKIILGPPGTGKTTSLLKIVEEKLSNGIRPNQIGFLSFTKRGAEEAINRACEQFKLAPEDFPYFRTLHSLCFRQLGMNQLDMMKRPHYKELGDKLGIELTNGPVEELEETPHGDKLLFIEGLSRLRCVPLKQQWEETNQDDINWLELDQLARGLAAFKEAFGLVDFTDLLSKYVEEGFVPSLEILLIDEAQDLSSLQWKVIERLTTGAKEVVIAGDDDQAIFRWAGADIERFIGLSGAVTVLDTSYRLNRAVHSIAEGISARIGVRREKSFHASKQGGKVEYVTSTEDLPLDSGRWLLLARHGYQLRSIEAQCIREGLDFEHKLKGPRQWESLTAARAWTRLTKGEPVDWESLGSVAKMLPRGVLTVSRDSSGGFTAVSELPEAVQKMTSLPWFEALTRVPERERVYLQAALRRKENFTGPARIRLSTIHGSKGGEAEKVAILTDMSFKTYTNYLDNADDELRVFYVGVTRAIDELYIVLPQTDKGFDI